MPDWPTWHDAYDGDTWLRRRLEIVQQRIREAAAGRAEMRVVSLCAGQARDLAGAFERGSAPHLTGRLVELDPANAAAARRALAAAGLDDVDVLCGDAALTDHYDGFVPAELVLACGVFGNLRDADVQRTIEALPMLCAEGGHIIWTRHRRPPDLTPSIRAWFADAGFDEVSFDAPAEAYLSVGVHRSTRPHEPLQRGLRLFDFVGADVLAAEAS